MNTTGQSQIDQARIEWAMRLRFSPFPELSLDLVVSQLNSFRIGDLWLATRTWEIMMERDADLAANINKRCEDVAALDWEIMSDGSSEGDRHAAALKYFYDHANVTNALDQDAVGDVSQLVWNIASAHATKYATHEMLLRVDNAAAREVTCEFRLTPNWFFECRRGYLGWLPHLFDIYGQPLKLGEWLPAVGYGHMRSCSILYVIKYLPLRDWVLFCSRFGIPQIQLRTGATKDSPEWNALMEAYRMLANDGVLITNHDVEIHPLQVGDKGELPFRPLIEEVNRAYAKLFRGSDLATSSRAREMQGEGKAVGASVQNDEKNILLAADARWVTPILNHRVDRPVIRYLFNAEPRAWIKLLAPTDEDTQTDLLTAQFCVQNGVPLSVATVRERFNWPEPGEGEPVLTPPVPPKPDGSPATPERGIHAASPSANGKANGNGNGSANLESESYAPGADPDRQPQTTDPRVPGGSQSAERSRP
jgi:phage gp29-like protein